MPEGASHRALALDTYLEKQAAAVGLPSFKDVVAQVRVYLLKRNADVDRLNNIYQILKISQSSSIGLVTVGPTIDIGATDSHYRLRSGARLSFGLTLREGNGRCSLVAYRFHIEIGQGIGPTFYRFDLNDRPHPNPLLEPRSHLHPGRDDVRLPFPVLNPLEILDRIFHLK